MGTKSQQAKLWLFTQCNNHNKILALCHFSLLHNIWDMNMHTTCTCAFCGYYDMTPKKHMSILGMHRKSFEREIPTPLGIDNTGHAALIVPG